MKWYGMALTLAPQAYHNKNLTSNTPGVDVTGDCGGA